MFSKFPLMPVVRLSEISFNGKIEPDQIALDVEKKNMAYCVSWTQKGI